VVAFNSEDPENYIGLIREALEQRYSKFREGYHVTDVVYCPRQQVFKEIDPVPLSDKDLNIYTSGKAVHESTQWLFLMYKEWFDKEKHTKYEDIHGSIDLYDKRKNIPIEFKTSRSNHIEQPKSFHVEQLKYYMAMIDAHTGYLIYQCLLHFENRPFRIFRITMTTQQRKEQLGKLVEEIKSLKVALQDRDPSLARSVYSDTNLRWLCKDCPYAQVCEKIRNGKNPFHKSGGTYT
jgi:CRISPR/Cas system-associated exonuclease Cas4 (RecB family)